MDQNGIVQVNPMNKTHGKHTHNYSSFPDSLSYTNHLTMRFGDYTPTFAMEGVPKDEISLRAKHLIDSLSLNAPFKGVVRKITESFSVPNMAILPLNWDRIYTQPSEGDDVPKDANCVLTSFPDYLSSAFMNLYNMIYAQLSGEDAFDSKVFLTAFVRFFVYAEYFLSSGSLPVVCGYHSNSFLEIYSANKYRSFDNWFDLVISSVFSKIRSFVVVEPYGSTIRSHYFRGLAELDDESSNVAGFESFRSFLELMRENPACYISLSTGAVDYVDGGSSFRTYLRSLIQSNGSVSAILPDPEIPPETLVSFVWHLPSALDGGSDDLTDMSQSNFNLSRILAYQLVCAHYYSNSAVDFVYSAELYRQYIHSLLQLVDASSTFPETFSWNGISCPYDYLSAHFLQFPLVGYASILDDYSALSGTSGAFINSLSVCSAIFGFRKSLRFGDYFVGSRPRPLAPVNTDVSVNNSMVSVIDITRSIQAQRFANSVMRSRSKIENYVADLFGKRPAPDFHNPFFLTRQVEVIYGDDVQNTGESQTTQANSRTSNFRSNNGQFLFTFHNDDAHPCIYLQIVSFDIRRAYTRSVDRQFLHLDRFDMFNPDFQYIGDQPIYGVELGYTLNDGMTIPSVFGYQGRDMEFKQRFDVASGGFVENLPGWILTDRDRSVKSYGYLDPDFIRSYNTEFDQFFLSLTGFSLGSYFHFIVSAVNNVSAKRAMAVDPQILE